MELIVIKAKNDVISSRVKMLELQEQWENFCAENELYKELKKAESEYNRSLELEEKATTDVILNMLVNNINEFDVNNIKFRLKDTSRASVRIDNLEDVPDEFIRMKKEADKKAIMKYYQETGVLINGIDIVKEPNYKLEVKQCID